VKIGRLNTTHGVLRVSGTEDASRVGSEAVDGGDGRSGGGVPGTGAASDHRVDSP